MRLRQWRRDGCFLEKPVPYQGGLQQAFEVQKKTGARVMVGQVVRSFGEYRYLKDIYEKKDLWKAEIHRNAENQRGYQVGV